MDVEDLDDPDDISFDLLLLWTLTITLIGIDRILSKRRKRNRRWWVRPENIDRPIYGHNDRLFRYFHLSDGEQFYDTMRVTPEQFNMLVDLITPFLRKFSIRRPLSTELRLGITLSYLAQGNSIKTQSLDYYIGRSTTYKIIPETCEALWKALQPTFLPRMTEERWAKVAEGFFKKWQFPNCIGAIDGKHVRIKAPKKSGSQWWCYKDHFTVVLMATCDAYYRFTYVDIGKYGSISDGGVWSNSTLGTVLEQGQGDLPPPKPLPSSDIVTQHALVGDEAIPLKTYLLRPYARNNLQDAERVFNYRLSRARRVIENTFGILVTRWQIYHKMIGLSPESVSSLIRGTVCLHNLLMAFDEDDPQSGDKRYCPTDLLDRENENHDLIEGQWRQNHVEGFMAELERAGADNRGQNATAQRDILRDYFVSPVGENQAPWQYTAAFRGLEINVPE